MKRTNMKIFTLLNFVVAFQFLISCGENKDGRNNNINGGQNSKISAGGYRTCIVSSSGMVKCWGGWSGITSNQPPEASKPEKIESIADKVKVIAIKGAHSCVVTSSGGVKCWGGDIYGQTGVAKLSRVTTPTDVYGLTTNVKSVTAGAEHTCALTSTGGVKCFGRNVYGQLGNGGDPIMSSQPVDVMGLSLGVKAISAGGTHTCALMESGGVKCWGSNGFGELGNGTSTGPQTCYGQECSQAPVDVVGLSSGVVAIASGLVHTCALTSSGGVKCWGHNDFGQLGNGTNKGPEKQRINSYCSTTPVEVTGLTGRIRAIAAGGNHTCAITSVGGVKCWGQNHSGQLGNGTSKGPEEKCGGFSSCSTVPVDVVNLTTKVQAVAVGDLHACVLISFEEIKCWGSSMAVPLGTGTIVKPDMSCSCFPMPVEISGL